MNTRKVLDDSTGLRSLSVEFNSDASLFAVGLEKGFRIYSSENCEAVCRRDIGGGIGAAIVRDRSDCIGLIGGGRFPKYLPNQVIIWNDSRQTALLKLEFNSAVQRVQLSRAYIVITLLERIILQSFESPPTKLAEFETAHNPFGLCCLGSKTLALPGRSHGQVRLVELANRNVSIIPAHSTSLRALALSRDEKFLVTASENGTLIRVWLTANNSKVAELRRGVDPAIIFSVAVSPSSTYLAVTSDKSTLHLFDLSPFTQASSQASTQRLNIPGYPRIPTPTSPAASSGVNKPHEAMSSSSTTAKSNSSTSVPSDDLEAARKQKWGLLGKIPLMPRVFSDTYSFASVPFVIGGEPIPKSVRKPTNPQPPSTTATLPLTSSWRPSKFDDWDVDADDDTDNEADYPAAVASTAAEAAGAAVPSRRSFSSSALSGVSNSTNAASSSVSNIPASPNGKPPKGQIGWLSDEQLVVVGAGYDSRWERFRIGVTDDGRRVCYREGWKRYLDD